ncbi:MAG: arginine--tRNA ligase [candidate division Zixibacteria bacterium]|nr:arginine--tRNA ligase [candidate division Zixibacteria bacterium]
MNPIKAEVIELISRHTSIPGAEVSALLETPPNPEMGDYAFPCFILAKREKKSPAEVAKSISQKISPTESVQKVIAAGPYLNFYLDPKRFLRSVLTSIEKSPQEFGSDSWGKGKPIVIDYSSPNIAKPFGIGHLRSTAIGHSLALIFRKLGHPVVGVNHLGDWGTQFGKLIVAFRRWGIESALTTDGVKYLSTLYTRFHQEAEKNPKLEDNAREEFRKLEQGDENNRKLWERFREISLAEFSQVYAKLDIKFDSFAGESFYNDRLENVLKTLQEKKLTEVSQEALVVNLDKYDMPPCLIRKKDEATLYTTRDLAAAIYRHNTYKFYKSLYVVGSAQQLHFNQVFKVLELMDYDWSKDCVHVDFGWVKFEDQILSTRAGHVLLLEEVLDKSTKLVAETIQAKNPELEGRDEVAGMVGIGAVIFAYLSRRRQKDFDFVWEEVLNFERESGPYLQYTHARLCSLQRKYGQEVSSNIDFNHLDHQQEFQLAKLLDGFPDTIKAAAAQYEPHILAAYLIKVAGLFNSYYQNVRVISDNTSQTAAKMLLVKCTQITLKEGLRLLGIKSPERM